MFAIDPGENIIYEGRKHPFHFYANIFGLVLALLLLPVLIHFGLSLLYEEIPLRIGWIAIFAYLIFLGSSWIYIFVAWTNYFLDTIIVTDKRVIDFNMVGMFSRDVATTDLGSIVDITIHVSGVINTFLKIGNIQIQTPAEGREFIVINMHKPEQIKTVIMEQANKYKKTHPISVVNVQSSELQELKDKTIETTPEPDQKQTV